MLKQNVMLLVQKGFVYLLRSIFNLVHKLANFSFDFPHLAYSFPTNWSFLMA
jgi:hypothetical protein